jgi:hypothetical protein
MVYVDDDKVARARMARRPTLSMNVIEPPDSHYLQAACGWLGLGDDQEAEAELERIRPPWRHHPDVLQVRWQIHARRKEWDPCFNLAKSLTQITPERRFGWVHLAFSLHRLNRTEEARESCSTRSTCSSRTRRWPFICPGIAAGWAMCKAAANGWARHLS